MIAAPPLSELMLFGRHFQRGMASLASKALRLIYSLLFDRNAAGLVKIVNWSPFVIDIVAILTVTGAQKHALLVHVVLEWAFLLTVRLKAVGSRRFEELLWLAMIHHGCPAMLVSDNLLLRLLSRRQVIVIWLLDRVFFLSRQGQFLVCSCPVWAHWDGLRGFLIRLLLVDHWLDPRQLLVHSIFNLFQVSEIGIKVLKSLLLEDGPFWQVF